MLLLNTQLQNMQVMSLQSGGSLGTLKEPIVDPRTLAVAAYYVAGPRISEISILHASDIREVGPLGAIVDSADSIMPLDEDLVRLQEVINLNFTLLGKPVVDDTKKKLGKVIEYTLEGEGFRIMKLHVSQSIVRNLANTNILIHRSQIVEITNRVIIVRSATIQEPFGLAQALNPFRKSAPVMRTESSRSNAQP